MAQKNWGHCPECRLAAPWKNLCGAYFYKPTGVVSQKGSAPLA